MVCWSRPIVLCTTLTAAVAACTPDMLCECPRYHPSFHYAWKLTVHIVHPHCLGVSLACYKLDCTCIKCLPGRPELACRIVLAVFVGHLRSQSHCLAHHGAFAHECWRMCGRRRLQEESWSVLHCHHIYQRLLAVTDQRKKTWLGNITITYLTSSWQSHQDIVH